VTTPKTWIGVVREFEGCSDEIKSYFEHFISLTKTYPWDVVIAYLFSRVELAQNMIIYCGCVKCHRVDAELARTAVNEQHMTRRGFREFYKSIFGTALPREMASKLGHAEEIRDKILHGKPVSEEDKRKAVVDIIRYAEITNDKLNTAAGFKPFGSLKGFKGRGQALDRSTSRWVLKGIGFEMFQ